jgi:hypothetical protein
MEEEAEVGVVGVDSILQQIAIADRKLSQASVGEENEVSQAELDEAAELQRLRAELSAVKFVSGHLEQALAKETAVLCAAETSISSPDPPWPDTPPVPPLAPTNADSSEDDEMERLRAELSAVRDVSNTLQQALAEEESQLGTGHDNAESMAAEEAEELRLIQEAEVEAIRQEEEERQAEAARVVVEVAAAEELRLLKEAEAEAIRQEEEEEEERLVAIAAATAATAAEELRLIKEAEAEAIHLEELEKQQAADAAAASAEAAEELRLIKEAEAEAIRDEEDERKAAEAFELEALRAELNAVKQVSSHLEDVLANETAGSTVAAGRLVQLSGVESDSGVEMYGPLDSADVGRVLEVKDGTACVETVDGATYWYPTVTVDAVDEVDFMVPCPSHRQCVSPLNPKSVHFLSSHSSVLLSSSCTYLPCSLSATLRQRWAGGCVTDTDPGLLYSLDYRGVCEPGRGAARTC